jgi:hypothetical protein
MILGLCGFSSSGKDSAALHLVENHGFIRVAFADKLREYAYNIDPDIHIGDGKYASLQYLVDQHGWELAKRQYKSVREFLQKLGHMTRETFGDSFWINQALNSKVVLNNERIVITDVRYQNEIDAVVDCGGYIIRIHREGVGPVNNHVTEKELPFDYVVHNPEGYLPGFHTNLDFLLRNLESLQ